MTLRLYAERKGLPLDQVAVRLSHEKIHTRESADCETKEGLRDEIELTLELAEPLDDAARQRLLEIAGK